MVAKWFGYNMPFLSSNSVMAPQYDTRLIKNDLLMLLLTSPGERRGRPNFGTILRKFPFEQLDNKSLNALQINVKQAIDQYEPRVKFKKIVVTNDTSGTGVTVKVYTALVDAPTELVVVDIMFPFATTG
jgi:phage baseplate assembly protein W